MHHHEHSLQNHSRHVIREHTAMAQRLRLARCARARPHRRTAVRAFAVALARGCLTTLISLWRVVF